MAGGIDEVNPLRPIPPWRREDPHPKPAPTPPPDERREPRKRPPDDDDPQPHVDEYV